MLVYHLPIYAGDRALFAVSYSRSEYAIQNRHMNRFNGHDRRQTIGHRIYLERTARRLRQRDISNRIADLYGSHNTLSQRRISCIETGQTVYIDVVELDLIAKALEVPLTNFTNP